MQEALAPSGPSPTGPAPGRIGQLSCTRGLADWLTRHRLSLAFTSYQSGRLYLCGSDGAQVHFHERLFVRAMALWTDPQDSALRKTYGSLGAQVDMRISVLYWYDMILSTGFAAGYKGSRHSGNEWMISLKIL